MLSCRLCRIAGPWLGDRAVDGDGVEQDVDVGRERNFLMSGGMGSEIKSKKIVRLPRESIKK